MSGKALKEKLEERLQNNIECNKESEEYESSNVVPFIKPDSQSISIVPNFAITLQEAKNRIQMLQSFVREMMIQGVDFGIVPGCNKPSLLKPGAEKLCDIFGFSKHIEMLNRIEDWEKGIFHYEIKATLISKKTGHIEAEGLGCCNNREKKYKNQEAANVINTILKMAKKRALIDAVLSATRSSGIFTQDIEEIEIIEAETPLSAKASVTNSNSNQNKKAKEEFLADKDQLSQILKIICQKKIPLDKAKDIMLNRYKVKESKLLTAPQAIDFISYLNKYRVV